MIRAALARACWENTAPPLLVDLPTVMGMLRVLRQLTDDRAQRRIDRVRLWWLGCLLRAWRRRGGSRTTVVLSRRYLRRLFDLVDRCSPAQAAAGGIAGRCLRCLV
jgi:hypothetical protein